VTQPRFISELGDGFVRAIGRRRSRLCYPLATLVRRGIRVAGSSDRPVVAGAPLLGIHDAVNQLTGSGEPYAPEEALTPEEALRLFTANAAFASFEDHRKGTLTPGKLADFVVLDADPTAVPKAEIAAIPIVATFVGGDAIYDGGL
jgi:predicted amidohydrolase YtcJ